MREAEVQREKLKARVRNREKEAGESLDLLSSLVRSGLLRLLFQSPSQRRRALTQIRNPRFSFFSVRRTRHRQTQSAYFLGLRHDFARFPSA